MIENILDLPFPPSVNKTRRIDWRGYAEVRKWQEHADGLVLASRRKRRLIPQQFEVTIILSEKHGKSDLDNSIKVLIDYARRIECVKDDAPKFMRRVVIEWGNAPEGCRVILRELPEAA